MQRLQLFAQMRKEEKHPQVTDASLTPKQQRKKSKNIIEDSPAAASKGRAETAAAHKEAAAGTKEVEENHGDAAGATAAANEKSAKTAAAYMKAATGVKDRREDKDEEILTLIREQKTIKKEEDKERIREVSKTNQNMHQRQKKI